MKNLVNPKRIERVLSEIIALTLIVGLGLLVVSCGGSNQEEELVDNINQPSFNPPPGGGGGTPPIPDPDPFEPAYTYTFEVSGTGGEDPVYETPEIYTDSILRVKVIAGQSANMTLPGYQAYSFPYGCVQYTVTVRGRSVRTDVLRVEGGDSSDCPNAPTEQIIDFSERVNGGEPVTVQVDRAKYNLYCRLWWYGYIYGYSNLYCPTRTVYRTHYVSGDLAIEVNGTSL